MKPKVLQVGKFYPPHRGGIESHLYTLCNQLAGQVELEVLVSNTSRQTVEESINGVPVTRLGTVATIASASINPDLVNRLQTSRADIIHLHLPNPVATLAYLHSRIRSKLVVSYHSDIVRQRVLGALLSPALALTLRRCPAIIAASPNYLSSSSVLKKHRRRCRIIPYGVDRDCFAPPNPEPVRQFRTQYGERIVLSVGRLVYYKGFEYLICAMSHVNGTLLIAGEGPLRPRLEELTSSLGLSNRVIFLGNPSSEDLKSYYHAADIFVLASVARSEAFGIVQVEAMAAGKPVINTDLASGVPFVSQHLHTGLTVPPRNVKALAAAMNTLLDSPELRFQYGHAARLRAQKEFTAEAMANSTLETYLSVLSAVSN